MAAADRAARDQQLCAWVEQYGPGLRRFLLKRVSATEADHLVQEAFIALRARRVASEIENVEGYLFKTAVSVLARLLGDSHSIVKAGLRYAQLKSTTHAFMRGVSNVTLPDGWYK